MGLTDTAEYWQSLKRNYPYVGPNYYHIPGADCGHRHLYLAEKLGDINCRGCLKLIKEGYDHKLPEGETLSKSEYNTIKNLEKRKTQLERYFGKCSCGAPRIRRRNKNTRQSFYGCFTYPKCKITSNYETKL